MTPDNACFNFIKNHEGCKLTAYQDSAGIWTIGYGTITYEDHSHVKRGDAITLERAEQLLEREIIEKSKTVNAATGAIALNQHQYNALVSFAYNAGAGALLGSTLLKRIKINPSDPTIREGFMMWDKARVNGAMVAVAGLKNRRDDEADLYFS